MSNLPIISAPKISVPTLLNAPSLAPSIPSVSSLVPKIDIPKLSAPALPKVSIPKLPIPSVNLPKVSLPSLALPPRPDGLAGIISGLKKPNFSSIQAQLGGIVKMPAGLSLPSLPSVPSLSSLTSGLTAGLPELPAVPDVSSVPTTGELASTSVSNKPVTLADLEARSKAQKVELAKKFAERDAAQAEFDELRARQQTREDIEKMEKRIAANR